MIQPTSLRFTGDLQKRIKRHRKAEEKEQAAKAAAEAPKRSKRKERIAQYQAILLQDRLENQQRYKAGLERFIADPKSFEPLMQTVIFTDEKGPFTAKDLLQAIHQEIRKNDRISNVVFGALTVTVLVPAIAYLENIVKRGDTKFSNIYEKAGTPIWNITSRFSSPDHKIIRNLITQFEEQVLVEINRREEDGLPRFKTLTPLGKRLIGLEEKL